MTDIDGQDDLYNADPGLFKQGNYHLYDLAFFYRNLQENIKIRTAGFKER